MTITVAFNKDLLLWIIWGYIVLSGFISIFNSITKETDRAAYFIVGIAMLFVALLVVVI